MHKRRVGKIAEDTSKIGRVPAAFSTWSTVLDIWKTTWTTTPVSKKDLEKPSDERLKKIKNLEGRKKNPNINGARYTKYQAKPRPK